MTLYMFTNDVKGASSSACTGQCLTAWPPAIAAAAPPGLSGVTGEVGTIDTADGRRQLTLSGWPLHYFAKDTAPGAVLGQGVGGIWYVLDPAGNPLKTAVGEAPGAGY
jgi:predicted lipoprotein with Yx(FWY)xxD motif